MRPVRRGDSPQAGDFDNYRKAFSFLVSRLGGYCSYCERKIVTQLAVEHIQPKGLAAYAPLEGRWHNFLLGCVNCNSTKGDKDVDLAKVLLPDRDNTFVAFDYTADGKVCASSTPGPAVEAKAKRTLGLVGLDKKISQVVDENGKVVAIDRVSQRMQAWMLAQVAKDEVDSSPGNEAVRRLTVELAKASGFFSIWMTVFALDAEMRKRLVAAFDGTGQSGCFDPLNHQPCSPAPNPDGLPHGGKV